MVTTPRSIIDSVVRSVCGRELERLTPLAGGGMNEAYRADLAGEVAVVVRIARQDSPWFVDEACLMGLAREAGVPTAEVLGLEHRDHDGELLSFSIQEFLPGRLLSEVVGELTTSDLEALVMDLGEILARVHSVIPNDQRGILREQPILDARDVARVAGIVSRAIGPAAATAVVRGADLVRHEVTTRPSPPFALVQGDFCPKNVLIHGGTVAGVIDWEFAGSASPAYDFAQWEVDAGERLHDRLDLLRRGYARVADPEAAEAGWTPVFAIDWALEKLGWKNPASPAQFRRCLDVITRYTTP